jgi:pilus assembly protein CpaF
VELLNLENYKAEIHRTLISKLDLEKLSRVNSTQARQAVSGIVKEIIADQRVPLNFDEQEKIQADLLDEVFGLGPLEPLLRDPKISDIMVNSKDSVFIEKGGLLQKVNTSFRDDRHLLQIIDRIVSRVGRRVDESSPMVDARLPDGSRVNAIIPPLALDGPSLSIRRFGTGPLAANTLVDYKSLSAEMMELLSSAVKARISIVISGGTGSGTYPTTSVWSPSRTPPNFASPRTTWSASKRGRRILKATAPSSSASCSSTVCVCAPTASSWARSAAKKRSTCCRP